MLCLTCNNRQYCSTLCPEAELFVNQDHKSQHELPVENIQHGDAFGRLLDPKLNNNGFMSSLSPLQRKVANLLLKGLNRQEIIDILGLSVTSFYNVIYKIRKKRQCESKGSQGG